MATAFSLWRPSAGTQLLNIFCKHNRRLGITNWISGRQDRIFKKERLTICGQKLWFLLVKWDLCFSHSCRDCLISWFCHVIQSQGSSAAMGARVSYWALMSGVSYCLSKIIPRCHVWQKGCGSGPGKLIATRLSDNLVWKWRSEREEEGAAAEEKRTPGKWDGQAAVCASLCEEWAGLYSGFICVMLCDSIVRRGSTELVFPPSHHHHHHRRPCCR